jgi:hypothetical protein
MFNIRPEIADFFKPYFQNDTDDRNLFNYGRTDFETWTPELHRIPTTQELWLAGGTCPEIVTDLFIGYSAADIICFASQQSHYLLNHPEQKVFAAIGLLPAATQTQLLKAAFPFAHWHLLFGPELLGRIADGLIATWYRGYPVSFRVTGTKIIAKYRNKVFYFEEVKFSLHRFELATGLRSGMRTHKPPTGFNSFLAYQDLTEYDT